MSAVREVTGVTKTAIMLLDLMPVAVTLVIVLIRTDSLAMVFIGD